MRIKRENRKQSSRKRRVTGDGRGTATPHSSKLRENRKVEGPGREACEGENGKIKLPDIVAALADLVGKKLR